MRVSFPKMRVRDRLVAMGCLLGSLAAGVVFHLYPEWTLIVRAGPSTCLLKLFTGVPCVACRGTRAALALLRGDLSTAVGFNPLATLFLLAVVAFLTHLSITGRSLRIGFSRPEWVLLWTLFLLALAGNWAYVILQGG